ncbi:MAG: hypothetical protein FJ255_11000 [Phycisphaerae bacterium]|nr:hypothetical protein [Phycisphaerae bacterium]
MRARTLVIVVVAAALMSVAVTLVLKALGVDNPGVVGGAVGGAVGASIGYMAVSRSGRKP